ncbi:MAG: BadF/BadG/BcrA/BcrD ATPase family protein [Oscillospiraceae bacterium]
MNCIIGIDGGGTKTYAKAYDLEGNFLGEAKSGSSNLCSNSYEAVEQNIKLLIKNLMNHCVDYTPISICIGTAGIRANNGAASIKAIITKVTGCEKVLVLGDMELPIFAHDSTKNAVAMISGTGSIVFARNKNGTCARVGGWGHIVGDEGSGYWLTVKAIQAIMREFDHRGEKTKLTQLFLEHLNCNSPQDIITLIHGEFNKSQLASMAYLLDIAAKEGDLVAASILSQGAELLFELLEASIKTAGFDEEFAIIFIGGVLQKSEIINTSIQQYIKNKYPKAQITNQQKEAVDCAVEIATMQRFQ